MEEDSCQTPLLGPWPSAVGYPGPLRHCPAEYYSQGEAIEEVDTAADGGTENKRLSMRRTTCYQLCSRATKKKSSHTPLAATEPGVQSGLRFQSDTLKWRHHYITGGFGRFRKLASFTLHRPRYL